MKANQGFTLVELVATLVVALVLLAVGIPVFSTMIANNRAAADSNALITALQLARSEAVKRGLVVSVCAGNGTQASPTPTACSGNNDWAQGFLVLTGVTVVRVWDRLDGTVTVSEANGLDRVDFASDGTLANNVCLNLVRTRAKGAQNQRWLGVSTTGRTQVSSDKSEVQACP